MRNPAVLILTALLTMSGLVLAQEGSEIPPEIEELALTGVEANSDWEPYAQEFDGVEMVLVPAGCFMMGYDAGFNNEQPVHQVCFDEPFWIDRYEVTNAHFAQFGGQAAVDSEFSGDDLPREQVTWTEAQAFCDQRGARLPTEAEMEYAARGPDGLLYPWGNEFVADNVVHGENSGGKPDNVGSKPSGISWVGANDLSGNVWEWVSDRFGRYTSEPQVNPQGPSSGHHRVAKGGSWNQTSLHDLSAVTRNYMPTYWKHNTFGFRCARS